MMEDYPLLELTIGNEMTNKDKEKNFKHSYNSYETLDEARKSAQRATARSYSSEDIWQRIEETVVPDVDILINPVDVKTTAVK